MAYDLHAAELIVGLGAAADDPGRLPEPNFATYDQGVDGVGAAIASVVELIGLEGVVVVEPVRPCDELWARSNFAAVGGKKVWKQNFSKVAHHGQHDPHGSTETPGCLNPSSRNRSDRN